MAIIFYEFPKKGGISESIKDIITDLRISYLQ